MNSSRDNPRERDPWPRRFLLFRSPRGIICDTIYEKAHPRYLFALYYYLANTLFTRPTFGPDHRVNSRISSFG